MTGLHYVFKPRLVVGSEYKVEVSVRPRSVAPGALHTTKVTLQGGGGGRESKPFTEWGSCIPFIDCTLSCG